MNVVREVFENVIYYYHFFDDLDYVIGYDYVVYDHDLCHVHVHDLGHEI